MCETFNSVHTVERRRVDHVDGDVEQDQEADRNAGVGGRGYSPVSRVRECYIVLQVGVAIAQYLGYASVI